MNIEKYTPWLRVAGFLCFFTGFLSILLSLLGIQFSALAWMDQLGSGTAFLMRLGIMVLGIILLVISTGNFAGEDRVSQP